MNKKWLNETRKCLRHQFCLFIEIDFRHPFHRIIFCCIHLEWRRYAPEVTGTFNHVSRTNGISTRETVVNAGRLTVRVKHHYTTVNTRAITTSMVTIPRERVFRLFNPLIYTRSYLMCYELYFTGNTVYTHTQTSTGGGDVNCSPLEKMWRDNAYFDICNKFNFFLK